MMNKQVFYQTVPGGENKQFTSTPKILNTNVSPIFYNGNVSSQYYGGNNQSNVLLTPPSSNSQPKTRSNKRSLETFECDQQKYQSNKVAKLH